jgi:hypothetical protein
VKRYTWLWSIAACLLLAALAGCAEGGAPIPAIRPSNTPQVKELSGATPTLVPSDKNSLTQAAESEAKPVSTQLSPSARVIFELTPVAVQDDPLAYKIIGRATLDLAARLSVDAKDIQLISVSAVTWPEASLGCPEPGKVYAAATTPGYQIVLEFAGKTYEYHTDRRQGMVYCEPSRLSFPPDWDADEAVKLAKQDLAQRLGISIEEITVSAVLGQEFSAQAFQCQIAKERITRDESPQIISGQAILLIVGGHQYEYHANGLQVIFCRKLK